MQRYLSLPLALVVVALPGFCEIARADTPTPTTFAAKATSTLEAEAVAALGRLGTARESIHG